MSKIVLPNCITQPTTGRYLITPTCWNPEEYQALYHPWDLDQLMASMRDVLGDKIDNPAEVYISVEADGRFRVDHSDSLWSINNEGWIIPAKEIVTKPAYCTQPDVAECVYCSLVNYGLDCANNPIPGYGQISEPTKRQQVYDYLRLAAYVPSAIEPHLDALDQAGLIDQLSVEQLVTICRLMQSAYSHGRSSTGAEMIDNDAVWLDGIGGLERQPDGTWLLTMHDKPGAVAASAAAT